MTDIKPTDVHDGDLLTGSLWGQSFTDWEVIKPAEFSPCRFGERGGNSWVYLNADPGGWLSWVKITGRKPAPKPLLPWEEADAAPLWRPDGDDIEVMTLADIRDAGIEDAEGWEPGSFCPATHVAIPRELIERGRVEWENDYSRDVLDALRAILDAAGGAS